MFNFTKKKDEKQKFLTIRKTHINFIQQVNNRFVLYFLGLVPERIYLIPYTVLMLQSLL